MVDPAASSIEGTQALSLKRAVPHFFAWCALIGLTSFTKTRDTLAYDPEAWAVLSLFKRPKSQSHI